MLLPIFQSDIKQMKKKFRTNPNYKALRKRGIIIEYFFNIDNDSM